MEKYFKEISVTWSQLKSDSRYQKGTLKEKMLWRDTWAKDLALKAYPFDQAKQNKLVNELIKGTQPDIEAESAEKPQAPPSSED
jgi:hypothetical protein